VKFLPTPVDGAWLIEPEPYEDVRGSFARIFCRREFQAAGLPFEVVQSNLARNRFAGIVRGLHYQEPPAEERKLVRCVAGAVFDVIIDMRPASPTRHKTFGVRLDAARAHSLFIPAGVAHGYQTLEDGTDFMYLTDQFYAPGVEKGVRYNDPYFSIPWPLEPKEVTPRDSSWPLVQG